MRTKTSSRAKNKVKSGAKNDGGMKRSYRLKKDQSHLPMPEIFVSLKKGKKTQESKEKQVSYQIGARLILQLNLQGKNTTA